MYRAATTNVDHSKGVSLRFPRFFRIRADNKVDDAVTAEQIATVYSSQDIIKNQKEGKMTSSATEDFYF